VLEEFFDGAFEGFREGELDSAGIVMGLELEETEDARGGLGDGGNGRRREGGGFALVGGDDFLGVLGGEAGDALFASADDAGGEAEAEAVGVMADAVASAAEELGEGADGDGQRIIGLVD
jgi:hypothetical protein